MKNLKARIQHIAVLQDGAVFVQAVDQKGVPIGKFGLHKNLDEYVNNKTVVVDKDISLRLIKVSPESVSMIKVTPTYSALIGSPQNRIVSSNQYGNFIVGPTIFTAHPEDIRIQGVYRLNGLLTSTMPSTIITPISILVLDIPFEDTIKTIKQITDEFITNIRDLFK